ncbi:MAG: DUF542 domain-containing protein [Prevotella sp.]|jgi:regulator of cell morphogenesis and NO signaling|nr:DUF542 domain-containing protein [Prevotella sp.]
MNITDQSNIGQIVAENYRYVSEFKTVGIDFCCNGNRTVQDACKQKGIDSDKLLSQLKEAESKGSQGDEIDYKLWTLDLLADCIQKTHHRYVRQRIEEITPFLNKVVRVHGENHPELCVLSGSYSLNLLKTF